MRHIIALLFLITVFSGCRDKVICPAFQSTYILDDSVRLTYYSYLWKIEKDERLQYLADQRASSSDSAMLVANVGGTDYFAYVEEFMVPPNEVNKTRFGIVKYEPYWLKNYELKSAPMENVLSPKNAVEEQPVDVGEFVESDFSDTLNVAGDTTAVALGAVGEEDSLDTFKLPTLARAPKPKPKKETVYLYRYDPKDKMLNVEQEYYNKHFGQQLYRKVEVVEPRPQQLDTASGGGFWDFFDFLKRKKEDPQENEVDSATNSANNELVEDLTEEGPGASGN